MKKWIILSIVIVLWIFLHFFLDAIVKKKANATLSQLPQYTGHIGGVSTNILSGKLALRDVTIKQRSGDTALTMRNFQLNIKWLPLFHRHIVARLTVGYPTMDMVVQKATEAPKKAEVRAQQANEAAETKTGQSLPDLIKNIIPFRIDSFYLVEGSAHVYQPGQEQGKFEQKDIAEKQRTKPAFDIRVDHLNMTALNLTNNAGLAKNNLVATVDAQACLYGKSAMDLRMKLNPIAAEPTFNLTADLKDFDLTILNPFLQWQWGVDVKRGNFTLFMQASAADGAFKGYVKPLLSDLQMLNLKHEKNPVKIIKEATVDAVNNILKNHKTDTLATEVPFQGNFNSPHTGIWTATIEVLRNGFIQALRPRFDLNFKPNPKMPLTRPSS